MKDMMGLQWLIVSWLVWIYSCRRLEHQILRTSITLSVRSCRCPGIWVSYMVKKASNNWLIDPVSTSSKVARTYFKFKVIMVTKLINFSSITFWRLRIIRIRRRVLRLIHIQPRWWRRWKRHRIYWSLKVWPLQLIEWKKTTSNPNETNSSPK